VCYEPNTKKISKSPVETVKTSTSPNSANILSDFCMILSIRINQCRLLSKAGYFSASKYSVIGSAKDGFVPSI